MSSKAIKKNQRAWIDVAKAIERACMATAELTNTEAALPAKPKKRAKKTAAAPAVSEIAPQKTPPPPFQCHGNLVTGEGCQTPDGTPAERTKHTDGKLYDTCKYCKRSIKAAKKVAAAAAAAQKK